MITSVEDLEAQKRHSIVELVDAYGGFVNIALKTNDDEWGLAGIAKPFTSGVLFTSAVERDGLTLRVVR